MNGQKPRVGRVATRELFNRLLYYFPPKFLIPFVKEFYIGINNIVRKLMN